MNFVEFKQKYQKIAVQHYTNTVNDNPLVSICVQTYQHAEFIKYCLDGILMQKTKFAFEIILGDDASTDGTREICIEYAQLHPDKIRLFLHHRENNIKINGSATGRFNFLYNLYSAQGKYIALCEGDDYWTDPLKLQKQADFLETYPEFAICCHKVNILEEGQIKEDFITYIPTISTIIDLARGNYIHTPSCLFRNNTSKIFGTKFSNSPLGDYYLHMMNAQYGKIFCIDEVMAIYRVHQNSIWSSKSLIERMQKTLEAMLCILSDLSDIPFQAHQEFRLTFVNLATRLYDEVNHQKRLSRHSQPLVTICIPTYNGDKFITESISSALWQTYPNIEIILSDDSSSDKTVEIAKSLKQKSPFDFSIIEHNQYGLAQNWNFCISQAKGKYIKFLFQDDVLEPSCIEEMVDLAEQDEEIGLVFSPRQLFTNPEETNYHPNFLAQHEAKDVHKAWSNLESIQSGQELLQDKNVLDAPINKIGEPSTVLIKKEVFEQVGFFNADLCQLVDLEMWLRIMSQYKVGFVNKVLSHFRIHPQQQTSRNASVRKTILLDYQKLFYAIYSDARYPQLTRQQAFYRYAVLGEQDTELRQSRKQLAEQWLSIPDDLLENMYHGMLSKTHTMLVNSSIKYTKLTDDEQIFVNDLILNISQGFEKPKAIQHLLALMLYYRADQLALQYDLSRIPHWLIKDYLQFLFSSPAHFKELGEAEHYYNYMQGWLNYLHKSIFTNSDSSLWKEVVKNFAQIANFLPVYFNEKNLKDIYTKRAEIIEYFLKIHDCEVDYEFPERPANRKKIRLGILAGHFTPSAETFAYLPVYEYLSREFEVILYSLNQTGHPLEQYCQSCANSFKQLPNDLATQVNSIRADELDILFIATNMTAVTNQICLLATHRLARIQITSGGSVVTTGMRHMDYYISGTFTDPSPTAQEYYRENLVKLEGTAHCFSYGCDTEKTTNKVVRESLDIPETAVVFISGANFFKITPELINTWAKIIAEVSNSVLVLLPFGPNWSNSYPKKNFEHNLSQVFSKYGISTDRLIILDPQPVPNRDDIKEYFKIADVYLDSYPFAGTTSLVEPFQVNLPVIARRGNNFRSAMGAAMVQSLGISDLIADNEESYIKLAVNLGKNPELRQQKSAEIKEKMQDNPSFLDSRSYSAKIGNLFHELFNNYQINTLNENFRLREINLIIFPDWNQPEESVGLELQEVIKTLVTYPETQKTTLLIDTNNIAVEDAEMFLSSVAMNLLMEEDLDMTEELEIALVGELSNTQCQALLPRIQARIILENENQAALMKLFMEKLPQRKLESFQLSVV